MKRVETYDKPLPVIDALSRPYWDALKERRLTVQRCNSCGDCHFPPSPVCPKCLGEAQAWETVSGNATLLSWARFHRAYWPGYRDDLPYDVCVVKLDEGPVVVSNFPKPLRDGWRCGMRLRAVFEDITDTVTLPRFEAADASHPLTPLKDAA